MNLFGLLKKASYILVISFILIISPLLTLSNPVGGNGEPTVTTLPATNVTTNSARLNGNTDELTIGVRFEYGLTDAYGSFTVIQSPPPGNDFFADIDGLLPGTTYHFQVYYTPDFDQWLDSNDMTFTTAGAAGGYVGYPYMWPKVVTVRSDDVTDTSARLTGELLAKGSAEEVQVFFRYGTTASATNYQPSGGGGNATPAQVLTGPGTFNADISGLGPGTLYYFRAVAKGEGIDYGIIMTFTTGHKLTINMTGQTTSVGSSDNGQLLGPLNVTSGDGLFELNIPEGTVVLDKDGNPLQNININVSTDVPNPPPGSNIIGFVYNCEPSGATFDPPITLTMHYDPDALPEGVTEESLTIAFWNGSEWIFLEGIVDTVNHTVTVSISHFSKFAMMHELPTTPPDSEGSSTSGVSTAPGEGTPSTPTTTSPASTQPEVTQTTPEITETPPEVTPETPAAPPAPPAIPPAPAQPEQKAFNWWWIIVIVVGLAIIGWIVFRFTRKRD